MTNIASSWTIEQGGYPTNQARQAVCRNLENPKYVPSHPLSSSKLVNSFGLHRHTLSYLRHQADKTGNRIKNQAPC